MKFKWLNKILSKIIVIKETTLGTSDLRETELHLNPIKANSKYEVSILRISSRVEILTLILTQTVIYLIVLTF